MKVDFNMLGPFIMKYRILCYITYAYSITVNYRHFIYFSLANTFCIYFTSLITCTKAWNLASVEDRNMNL